MAQATKVEVLAGADGVLTDKDRKGSVVGDETAGADGVLTDKDRKGSVVGDETAGAFDMDMSLL